MAQDIFLKINGITGESPDNQHKDEIEVLSWHWEILQDSTMHSGSGGGAGKATVKDLVFVHNIDRASPNLMKYSLTGQHVDQAVLTMRKAGGHPLEYLTITMKDVLITGVHPTGNNSDTSSPEQVTLSFASVTQEYTVQNAQGGSSGTVTASYDIKGNKES